MPRLCAFGCPPREVPMHRFPDAVKFPEQFNTWVSLVGGQPHQLKTPTDFEYYKRKRICDVHFIDSHRNRNKRLSAIAVPMLNLPGQLQTQATLGQASTSEQLLQPTISQPDITGSSKNIASSNPVALEHNYSANTRHKRTAEKDLTCTKIKHLRAEISRLRKKGQSFMTRLKNAEKLSNNALFQHFAKNLTRPAQLFFCMLMQATKIANGRCFTTEQKVLALSLYKKSPKCYSLLYNSFTLPSTKAMKRLSSTIKIFPGINPAVSEGIKKTVLDKDIGDRLCSLIFSDKSLSTKINYDALKNAIDGFYVIITEHLQTTLWFLW